MKMLKYNHLLLLGVLIIGMYISYIPHLNYDYPLHVDEWFHITVAKEIVKTGSFPEYDPFKDNSRIENPFEKPWHYTLAGLIYITNPDITQFKFFPMLFSILAILSVYIFVRRYGEETALIAAFLTALIPSNLIMGGPSLLVPVNLSLIVIPLALKFAFDAKTTRHYIILFLLTLFILLAHPPSAIILLILLIIYSLLNLKDNRKKSRFLFISIFSATLLSIPNYIPLLYQKGTGFMKFPFWLFVKELPELYGYLPILFFIAGFYLLSKRRTKEDLTLIFGIIVLLIDIFIFTQTKVALIIPYQRIYIPLILLMNIVAAYALSKIRIKPLLIVILGLILIFSVQQHFSTPYYHIIDDEDYNNFIWIKDNTNENEIVLLDPFKARAFPAIGERRVYTVMPFGPVSESLEMNGKANEFFRNKCKDTNFLKENSISVIYSQVECLNTDLRKINDKIYTLK